MWVRACVCVCMCVVQYGQRPMWGHDEPERFMAALGYETEAWEFGQDKHGVLALLHGCVLIREFVCGARV